MIILQIIRSMEKPYLGQCLGKVIAGKESVKLMVFGCSKTFYPLINNQSCYHQSNKVILLGVLLIFILFLSRFRVDFVVQFSAQSMNIYEIKVNCMRIFRLLLNPLF